MRGTILVMKRKKMWKWIGCAVVVVCAGLFAAFISIRTQAGEKFAKGTILNGIDVSGMTLEELDKRIGQYSIEVVQKNAAGESFSETILGSDFSIGIGKNEDAAKKVLKGQGVFQYLLGKGKEHTLENWVEYDEDRLEEEIHGLSCFDSSKEEKPVDAHISEYNKEEGCYQIIAESDGNTLKQAEAFEAIVLAIHQMEPEVNLLEKECYETAAVTGSDKELTKLLEELNAYVGTTITYRFGEATEIVDGKRISKWIKVNKKNKVVFNKERISNFVSSLRRKYDTIFRSRKFKTSYGKTITVEGGDYGWWMNCKEEEKQLLKQLKKKKSGKRTPVYYQTAKSYDAKDYGDSYIEINLTMQQVFLYINGKKILETDCVTGNSARGFDTPAGTYSITYTERDATLTGENYSTPVKYWMPFNHNIGLHDASWRSRFGGEEYKRNGSHGCVNLPPEMAEKIFKYAEKGMPVICYHLEVKEKPDKNAEDNQEDNKEMTSKKTEAH